MTAPRLTTVACSLGLLLGATSCVSPSAASSPAKPPPTSDVAIGRTQDPQRMLAELSADFLADYFARNPVTATASGEHRHDDRWPDLSAEGRGEDLAWIELRLDQLALIPREALDADERIELDTIRNQLELARFYAAVDSIWTTDPMVYSGLISAGLDDLVSRDFAPIEERAQDVAARLETLPGLLEQARANLSDPRAIRRPHAEVAVGQFAGIHALIESVIPERTQGASETTRKRIAAATPPAIAALEQLEGQLAQALPKAQGRWRLGAEAFSTKLALTLQSELTADELVDLARAEHERVRRDMAKLARELYEPMFGAKATARAQARASQDEHAMIRAVLDELAADHPPPEGLRDAAEANLSRLDAFVREGALVPIDEREVLEVIWTPAHAQGVAIAGLAAPAPLDADKEGLPSFYLVQPLPDSWDAKLRESFLREYNSFMLEILSIHEAIPGHFVQLYWGKREDSELRRVFPNGAFVEGWAVYTERVMVDAGYAGAGPTTDDGGPRQKRPKGVSRALWTVQTRDELRAKAIRLHGLKFYLRTVTNAILDHEIHAGSMSREQAIELMVERSFQERGEAEGKWTRAQLTSTQLSTYFVGATAWFRLRERAQARPGFSMLDFHAAALSHGAPPVHRLPELMGWE